MLKGACLVILLVLPLPMRAQKAPVPTKIIEAKTVFLLNQTGDERHLDAAYKALRKWGRWEIVGDREKADLVLLLNMSEKAGPAVSFGSAGSYPGTTYCNPFPGTSMTNCTTYPGATYDTRTSIPTKTREYYIHVLDASSGDPLWTAPGTAQDLVDSLRKRFREQSSFSPKPTSERLPTPLEKQLQQTPVGPNSNPSAEEKQQQVEPSAVTLKSSPEGADITVDGKFIGMTPSTVQLAPGDHEVTIQKIESDVRRIAGGEVTVPTYKIWKRTLTGHPGGVITVDAILEKVQ